MNWCTLFHSLQNSFLFCLARYQLSDQVDTIFISLLREVNLLISSQNDINDDTIHVRYDMGPRGELVGLQRQILYVMQCQLRTSDGTGISFIFILLTFLISSGSSLTLQPHSYMYRCITVIYVTCDDDLIQVIIY